MAVGNPPGNVIHLADVMAPEVWADLVQAKYTGKLIMNQFAQEDDTLVGQPGDTIRFPQWNAMATDAQELDEDTEIAVEKITGGSVTATVQEIGKGAAITDLAAIASIGDPLGEAQTGVARKIREKIDADLNSILFAEGTGTNGATLREGIDAGPTAPVVVGNGTAGTGTKLGLHQVLDGILSFGDEVTPEDVRALLVNTPDYSKLVHSADFLTMDKLGPQAVIFRGQVGAVAGVPVVRIDRGMTTGISALVVGSPLQLIYKRRPITEYERKPSWRRTNVYTSTHYGVRRPDAAGSIVLLKHDPTYDPQA